MAVIIGPYIGKKVPKACKTATIVCAEGVPDLPFL
jgi:hypothetical protein